MQDKLRENFNSVFFDSKASVEIGELSGKKLVFINGEPDFMYENEKIIFTIRGLNKYRPKEKFVVVDMGAVKFVTSGADIMAPGIVDADKNIVKDDQVWICDETHNKPLAIGFAFINGEEMIEKNKGKAIKNIHYVGDELWTLTAKSL